MLGLKKK
jgi:hypothetical protein